MKQAQLGFSLVEMAMVIIVIGLLLGGLLMPVASQIEQEKRQLTQKRLETIKEALLGFAIDKGYLPCPADDPNSGQGQTVVDPTVHPQPAAKPCTLQEGYLPWIDLALDKAKKDAWGRPFRYTLDQALLDEIRDIDDNTLTQIEDNSGTAYIARSIPSVKMGTNGMQLNGNLTITHLDTTPAVTPTPPQVVAIIYSCGKNGYPEANNDDDGSIPNTRADCTNNLIGNDSSILNENNPLTQAENYTHDAPQDNFDDLLTWLPLNILIARLSKAGQWPPAVP